MWRYHAMISSRNRMLSVAFLASLLMSVFWMITSTNVYAVNSLTMDDVNNWLNNEIRLATPRGSGECTDFCNYYLQNCWGNNAIGGHAYTWSSKCPQGWSVVNINGSFDNCRKGDLLVAGISNESPLYGHVSVYYAKENGLHYVVDQNNLGRRYPGKGRMWDAATNITCFRPPIKTTPSVPQGKVMSKGYNRAIPDGDYIIVSTTGWFQLDILGDDKVAPKGKGVALYKYTQRPQDVFTLKYNSSNKFYSIKQKGTNMALDVDGASIYEGARVQMWPANTDNAQKWAISEIWDGGNSLGYRLQSAANGFSLDVAGGVAANGTSVRMWSNNNAAAQTWLFIPYKPAKSISDGKYILVSGLDSNIELDVRGDTLKVDKGVNVQIWHDNTDLFAKNSLSQYNAFNVQYLGDGYYKLKHGSGLCLDVDGGGHKSMANVHLWGSNSDYAQQWAIIKQGDGYNLWARCSGMTLDVNGGGKADGTNVRQYQWNGANAQKWKFVRAEYKVTYNANGGSNAPASQIKYYKGNLTLSNKKPVNSAKDFICWNTKSNGTGSDYSSGSVYRKDADLTLYAKWKEHAWGAWKPYDRYYHIRYCTRDSAHISKAGHEWDNGVITKAATSKTDGIRSYTCKACGQKKEEKIPANTVVPGHTDVVDADNVITNRKNDNDILGSTFGPLSLYIKKTTKTSHKLKWNKVSGAAKYLVYANKCGRNNRLKKIKVTTGTSFKHKKLKKATYYKYMVVAVSSKGTVLNVSKTLHSATKGGKVGNAKSVKTAAKKNKVTVKAGKTFKLKAKVIKASKKLKIKTHRRMKYETSNSKVATVSSKGVIKGKGKGKCYVYAYTQNGKYAKIKVTVK